MQKFLLPAIVIAALIGLAIVFLPEPDPRPLPAPAPDQTAAPQAAAPATPGQPAAPGVIAPSNVPSFDVVRITRDGNAVMAGRAEPGADVTVLDQGKELGTVKADQRGEWVLVPTEPLPAGARELTLRAEGQSGSNESKQVVVVAVPDREQTAPPSVPLAVLTPREGGGPSRVLQGPGVTTQGPSSGPVVDIVDYDEKGNLVFSGRAAPNAELRLYSDGTFLGAARSDGEGRWSMSPSVNVAPGEHELRVDQLGEDSKVIARIAMPFSRTESAKLDLTPGRVIVQPGNSLWRIARATYGEGMRYSVIYQANQENIRDPDLIYPGQVFNLPEAGRRP